MKTKLILPEILFILVCVALFIVLFILGVKFFYFSKQKLFFTASVSFSLSFH